jgi:hypothetical protein
MNLGMAAEEFAQTRNSGTRVIESALIRAEVAPLRGGKFVSLLSKRTGTEWLLPPLRSNEETSTEAGFELWDGGGFDECLPTVAPTATAPDHGEVWRHAWDEEDVSESAILLRTTALDGSIVFARRAHVDGPSLVLEYTVENQSDTPQSLMYCAHPLIHVEHSDRILLPQEVHNVTIGNSAGNRLGQGGMRVAWPINESGEDLSIVGEPDGEQADKLFGGPLTSGWCALIRPSLDEGIELTFDTRVLPYLGLWICRAAWPASGTRKQYTVAFEPTCAPFDSVADAERTGMAWKLAPQERKEWTLRFRLGTQRDVGSGKNVEGPQ